MEARVQARACAQGMEAESYIQSLIENAVRTTPIAPRRAGATRDMDVFFKAMAANSGKLPQLPEEAFTREGFYRDHD